MITKLQNTLKNTLQKLLILFTIALFIFSSIPVMGDGFNWPVTEYIPPDPINLTSVIGKTWINHTWEAGIGNITNSYNVSINNIWYNNTINTFFNHTGLTSGDYSNITIWAFNSTGATALSSGHISAKMLIAIEEPPINISFMLSLIIILIIFIFISIYTKSPLLSIIIVPLAWYIAFEHTQIPLIAIFFGLLGLLLIFNSIYFTLRR